MQRYRAADGYATADLLQYGRDHLASAGVLFERSYSCFDSAAHLSHLGLELTLKAVLLDVAGSFPNEHDLVAIFTEIRQHSPTFDLVAKHKKTLAAVTRFVDFRYPAPKGAK